MKKTFFSLGYCSSVTEHFEIVYFLEFSDLTDWLLINKNSINFERTLDINECKFAYIDQNKLSVMQ